MNKEAQDVLNRIVIKTVGELTQSDREFLMARRSYLSELDADKFAEVLNPPKEKKEDKSDELVKLQEHAKSIGIKSVHFYKDVDKLKEKIAEVEAK